MDIPGAAQRVMDSWIPQKQSSKWLGNFLNQGLPQIVTLLLVILLAQQAANLTWKLIPEPSLQSVTIPPEATTSKAKPGRELPGEEAKKIAELHLFGRAGVAKVTPKKVDTKAPETRLNLSLHGVFVEEDPAAGAAIIGKSGSSQDYYKVGNKIMSGVKLQAVFNDRVVLERNGKAEVLRFPKPKKSLTQARTPNPSPSSKVSSADKSSLKSYRDMFQQEPLKIFEHVRFVPVRSGKTLKGYRVLPQKNRELYNKLGIRPSDLVTAVNGVSLSDDKEAMQLINKLKDAEQIDLDIVRKGQAESLSLSLN